MKTRKLWNGKTTLYKSVIYVVTKQIVLLNHLFHEIILSYIAQLRRLMFIGLFKV